MFLIENFANITRSKQTARGTKKIKFYSKSKGFVTKYLNQTTILKIQGKATKATFNFRPIIT